MIRKSGKRFSLATNAKRLRGDHAQTSCARRRFRPRGRSAAESLLLLRQHRVEHRLRGREHVVGNRWPFRRTIRGIGAQIQRSTRIGNIGRRRRAERIVDPHGRRLVIERRRRHHDRRRQRLKRRGGRNRHRGGCRRCGRRCHNARRLSCFGRFRYSGALLHPGSRFGTAQALDRRTGQIIGIRPGGRLQLAGW